MQYNSIHWLMMLNWHNLLESRRIIKINKFSSWTMLVALQTSVLKMYSILIRAVMSLELKAHKQTCKGRRSINIKYWTFISSQNNLLSLFSSAIPFDFFSNWPRCERRLPLIQGYSKVHAQNHLSYSWLYGTQRTQTKIFPGWTWCIEIFYALRIIYKSLLLFCKERLIF